jgi:hypothetical protein
MALLCSMSDRSVAETPPSDLTIAAIAPLGMTEAALGRPYSARFEPLIGKEARSAFPTAKAPRKVVVSAWQHQFLTFDSSMQLRANARALTVTGSAALAKNSRVVVWRAVQLTHAIEIDDTTEPRPVGSEGAFYVRKIYFGRVYDVVISGTEESFTAGVRAELLAYGGGVDALKKKYNLRVEISARGLQPKAMAVFAQDAEEVRAAYVEDPTYNSGKPVPVLVEFRRLPGAAVEEDAPIDWKEGDPVRGPSLAAGTKLRVIRVAGSNSDWSDTGLVANAGDLVVGSAFGKVTFGWGSTSEPDTAGTGGLDVRVGTTAQPAGKSFAIVDRGGPVKLRVRDNKYSDNKGEFFASVMVIPRDALGDIDCKQVDANGQELGACEGSAAP